MTNPAQTIAFFGATGGTAGSALAHALQSGYHCTALARTPQKLIDLLTKTHHLPSTLLSSHLTIIPGDAKDVTAVTQTLLSPLSPTHLVSTIILGIGSLPTLRLSLLQPITLKDPTICHDCTATIFSALDALHARKIVSTINNHKPLLVFISTTGVSRKARDVPLALYPMYHFLLQIPHEDKRRAENLIMADAGRHVRDFVIVRPTLLSDAEPLGLGAVRSGWEWGTGGDEGVRHAVKEPGPVLGYSVGRRDVGEWMLKKIVVEGGWEGKCVSLTY